MLEGRAAAERFRDDSAPPQAFARKNAVRETECASAISAVPEAISRRMEPAVQKIAQARDPVRIAENDASLAMREASPNWWQWRTGANTATAAAPHATSV